MCLLLSLVLNSLACAGTWIRYNHLGTPDSAMRVVVLADSTREGAPWLLRDGQDRIVEQGILPATTSGIGSHNPKRYGATLDIPLADTGSFSLHIPGAEPARLRRTPAPYTFLAGGLVRHLRLMRSGPDQSLFRAPSHPGDTSCLVMVPDGSWSDGAWKPDPTGRRISLPGGWYDAGDQIKFTLTTAYTTYYLLRAYQANPGIHPRTLSNSALPDILEEARHGLDYLDRTLVDDSTFVIEVGDGADHSQGARLPQFDALDGKRPALSALSPMPMAYTAAALALGSRIFADLDASRSARWRSTALRLHALTTAPGASREAAFFRQEVNDFYPDPSPYDNLALMEWELYQATEDDSHRILAVAFADSADPSLDPGWTEVGLTVDGDLASSTPSSASRLATSFTAFQSFATKSAPLWGIPFRPQWGPLLGWPIVAAEGLRQAARTTDTSAGRFATDVLDYALGRNNWGVSMVMSRHIEHSVSRIYNPIYSLSEEFPEGAVAEGPGSKTIHTDLSQYISIPADAPESEFNTRTVVFFDHASDFQTMETTISQQATMLYLLAMHARSRNDTVVGIAPPPVPDTTREHLRSLRAIPLSLRPGNWSVYDDQAEQGLSTAELLETGDSTGGARFDIRKGEVVEYPYAGLAQSLATPVRALPWRDAVGLRLHLDLPQGRSIRAQVRTSDILDSDWFGTPVAGHGSETVSTILFRDFSQQGFGAAKESFDAGKAIGLDLLVTSVADSLVVKLLRAELLFPPSSATPRALHAPNRFRTSGNHLHWVLAAPSRVRVDLVRADGRRKLLLDGNISSTGSLELPIPSGLEWLRIVHPGGAQVIPLAGIR
ncbi:MAG: glycoside hydrolase family 9 protein [Fibrobacteria bacterium]|nr:glycoside hydrolase family 9 protein [Fibrobacteria bacterium]